MIPFLLRAIIIVTNASITQINTVDGTINKHNEYSTNLIIKNIYVLVCWGFDSSKRREQDRERRSKKLDIIYLLTNVQQGSNLLYTTDMLAHSI
ncbi:hypothetical protein V6Z11_D11G402600 [Gossypium hirsutum]